MKLLRNPVVVGALVVVAVLVLGYQLWPVFAPTWAKMWRSAPRAPSGRPAPTNQATAPAPRTAATSPATPAAELPLPVNVTPMAAIDRSTVWAGSVDWVESPRRDPFQGYDPDRDKDLGPFAKDVLRLQGVWRQTDSTLAVINNHVVAEGDAIQQFRVDVIEPDVVWVVGPRGQEKLEFNLLAPPPAEEPDPTIGQDSTPPDSAVSEDDL